MTGDNPHLHAVILAGGSGLRFWPLSRAAKPKQFLEVEGGRSLLRSTFERLSGLVPPERVLVVTGADHAARVREELPEIPADAVLAEPVGRDTAAAIAWAAMVLEKRQREARMLVLPADHVIRPEERFRELVLAAEARVGVSDALLTFGVVPTRPATGYGYIEIGGHDRISLPRDPDRVPGSRDVQLASVMSFREKPDLATARTYLASGRHYWNAGIFVWRATRILDELRRHVPALQEGLKALARGNAPEAVYPGLPRISIDYAVMEKANRVEVVVADFEWDDVGSWAALAAHLEQDASGNATRGPVQLREAEGNVVVGEAGHLVALLGVKDLVVVHTPDATLVCPKDRAEDVKKLVESMRGTKHGDKL